MDQMNHGGIMPPQNNGQIQPESVVQKNGQVPSNCTVPQMNGYNGYPNYPQMINYHGETEEQKAKRAEIFSVMAVPTLIYALVYTLCLYNNFHSIMMPVFVVATIVYCRYVMGRLQKTDQRELRIKPFCIFCMIGMILLGISTACTGSVPLLVMNNIGIFLLLVCSLLFQLCDTKRWTLAKGFSAIVVAVCGAIGSIGEPFSDFASFQRLSKGRKNTKAVYILLGIVIAIPILVIIIALLYYADAVFANVLRSLFVSDLEATTIVGIICTFGYAILAAYCGLRYLTQGGIKDEVRDHRRFEPIIANTVLALISIVYLLFSLIQILYLFWGKMQLPDGYTYANYAREGFFQLLFVCIINVILVLFFMGCFRENFLKRILLTVISFCTYIMLASSALRMSMYVRNYNLTFLRVFVFWALALIAILLLGILLQIYNERFPLFRYTIVVTTVCVLGLSGAHPDYWIAKYDLDNDGIRNYDYIAELSTDAASAVAEYLEGYEFDADNPEWVRKYVHKVEEKTEGMNLRTYNFSYAKAKRLLVTK